MATKLENLKKDLNVLLTNSVSLQKLQATAKKAIDIDSLTTQEIKTLNNALNKYRANLKDKKEVSSYYERIEKYIHLAIKKADKSNEKQILKEEKEYTKDFKHEVLKDFSSLFNTFNHIKKAMLEDNKYKNKATIIFNRKFDTVNIYGMFNFNDILQVVRTNVNFAQKTNFNLLVDKMIQYINLEVCELETIDKKGKQVNEQIKDILKDSLKAVNIDNLHDITDYKKPTKSNAKFVYNNNIDLFNKLDLIKVYDAEKEEADKLLNSKIIELGKKAIEQQQKQVVKIASGTAYAN